MKTLILIFVLFSASLMGQENIAIGYAEMGSASFSMYNENIAIGQHPFAKLDSQPLYSEPLIMGNDIIRYAKEYKTECYNDSTETCGWVFVQSPYQNSVYISGWDEYKCWYTHKEPTFSDFIDWISLKLNIE